ncbi:nucleotide-binding universal stress UspA family protein [Sinobaca qinghaiensis]|uniref:Universal stress protein n=1 Tax=Sinobaca qinghaiensis TaxID=342944 RepID=A0A419V7M9_9BACL|nr:universal stress protein [Sinobaca qinghaiensis]RKD76040.1 nucleotide-binding universal stress UspA family protein [Sinobaca qinghaiensis]
MENYKKILTAVDGSEESKNAFKKAVAMARREGAELVICHVVDSSSAFVSELEEYAKELLDDYEKQANDAGIKKVTAVLEHGSPKVKIPKELAGKYEVDLIIAGATGLGTVERFIIGSVSEQIARRAKCDVLIVRMKEQQS